jgi:glycosyltransferase involved in cell wall biosynthesis
MKLCIVTHKVIKGDGQGRVNYEVALEAIRRGHHLTLLASDVSPDLLQSSLVLWVPISVKGLPTELLKNLVFSQKSATWLQQHRAEFDIVKVNGAITSAKSDVNAVHFVHSSWLKSPAHPIRQDRNHYGVYQWCYTSLNAVWEKQAFQQARQVVAVSQQVKQELLEIGVPEPKIRVILNGVDLQEFQPGSGDRHRLNLPDAVSLAMFVGDIRSNRKNLETVLHALVRVPELHLAVVGATAESPYPELSRRLGLSQRAHFLGYRRDLPDLMRSCDLFVFPSRYEACTLVLLEAMASGLPIVTAKTAGGSEIVTEECGAILADPEDTDGLALLLQQFTNDPQRRHSMGRSARSIAQEHTWSRKAQAYVDLFEQGIDPS